MLKKLSIAGLVLVASSGIAFADPNDAMSGSDNTAVSDSASAGASTASDNAAPVKKHKRKVHHKRHHHVHHMTAQASAEAAPAPVADYKGAAAYKGEVCPTCPPPFWAGPYLGLSVGSLVNYSSAPVSYTGVNGNLFGGYGWLWDQWYAGLEIFAQDNAQVTNARNNVRGSVKSTWGYGASVLPGYLIQDNVLGFMRLGIIESRFSTRNSNKFGGQVGLGLETALCTNWDLRAEWVMSFYNSLSKSGSGAGVGAPKSQEARLGLIYKFQM